MKILFVTSDWIDADYGPSTHIREIVYNLSKQHKVTVIAQSHSEKNPDKINIKRITIPQLPYANPLFVAIHNILLALNIILIGLRLKSRYDVIYNRADEGGGGVLLGKLFGIPTIIEINGILWDEAKLRGRSEFRQNLIKWLWGLNVKHVDCIVTVTPNIAKEMQKVYKIPPDRFIIIQNGVNTNLFKPMDKITTRKTLGLNEQSKIVCFVGQLSPWQGVEYLIKAAPLILEKVPETKFLIIGDGEMREEWENMVSEKKLEDNFIFTGRVPYEDVPKYINASDVCVAPFIKERNERTGLSPLKLYEYLACGKPVVGSDVGGVGDFLEGYNAGVAVKPENLKELANATVKLLQDDELREKMGKNGREIVVKEHSWESIANKVMEVCESVIAEQER